VVKEKLEERSHPRFESGRSIQKSSPLYPLYLKRKWRENALIGADAYVLKYCRLYVDTLDLHEI